MACEPRATCEVIGLAVIGTNFKIGCKQCDPNAFATNARKGSYGRAKSYRKRLVHHGVRV